MSKMVFHQILCVVVVFLLAASNCGVQSQRLVGTSKKYTSSSSPTNDGQGKVTNDIKTVKAALQDAIEIDFSIYDSNDEFYVTVLNEDGYTLCEGRISSQRDMHSANNNLACKGVDETMLRYGDNLFFVTIYSLKKKEIYSQKTKHYYYYPTATKASYRRRAIGLKLKAISHHVMTVATMPLIAVGHSLWAMKSKSYDRLPSIRLFSPPKEIFRKANVCIRRFVRTTVKNPTVKLVNTLSNVVHSWKSSISWKLNNRNDFENRNASFKSDDKQVTIRKDQVFRSLSRDISTTIQNQRHSLIKKFASLSKYMKIPSLSLDKRSFAGVRNSTGFLVLATAVILIWLKNSVSQREGILIGAPSTLSPPPPQPPSTKKPPSSPPLHPPASLLPSQLQLDTMLEHYKRTVIDQQNQIQNNAKITARRLQSILNGWYQLLQSKSSNLHQITLTLGGVALLLMQKRPSQKVSETECVASYESGGKQTTSINIALPRKVVDEVGSSKIDTQVGNDSSLVTKRIIIAGLAMAAQSLISAVSGTPLSGFRF